MNHVDVFETFVSIQGESSYAGLPCFFIRLAGCNLRCRYCDTPAATAEGTRRSVAAVLDEACATRAPLIEITGGEPLRQAGFAPLVHALRDAAGKKVLVETNGSRDIAAVPAGVVTILDIKSPASGEADAFDTANLGRLRDDDEVKFVLMDRPDYEWARAYVQEQALHNRCRWIHFSPAHGHLDPATLAKWILEDGLPVRVQLQLHRLLHLR